VFEFGGTDCNYTSLFYWRLKIWFQLAREFGRSVLRAPMKLGPSRNVSISLCIASGHRWLLYVLFVVQPNSVAHPSDIAPHPNEACTCERFLNKEGLESLDAALVMSK
jgi:hypothetical protein